jgi:hypothetical protein
VASTTATCPLGCALLSEVLTATSTRLPVAAADVGSPPSASEPAALGAARSVMSTKPIRLAGQAGAQPTENSP